MKILALQGGGTRGIMQSTILNDLLSPKFDLIAGTSVGAIVGGCYAAGVTASAINNFFTQAAPKIFSGAWWIPLPRLWASSKYSPDTLKASLAAIVGDATLADCSTPFIATAFEMTTGRPVYFQSYGKSNGDGDEIIIGPDSGMELVDVMMASSAAQSYFPGHAWKSYMFWDGGSTGFNAPDMLALSEARELGNADHTMLSLGNGNTPWPYAGQDMSNPGIAGVLQATVDIAYSGPEDAMVWLAKQELGAKHTRINPVIPDYPIDDASGATLNAMQLAAHDALKQSGFSI